MSFPRYPEYKDSGVEWLGEVPGHWRALRIKHLLKSLEQGWSPQCEAVPVESPDEWGVLKVGCVNGGVFNASENKALPTELEPIPDLGIRAADLLISRANTRELVGSAAVALVDHSNLMLCDKLFRLRFEASVCSPHFIAAYFSTKKVRGQIELAASGASSSMLNIGQSTILEMAVALPHSTEQAAICDFLRSETAKLDDLMAEQEKLIALLKEKRQAVIAHAVTKGLDPAVPMKDSGIEWLGEMPEHWQLKRVKHFVDNFDQGWSPQCESYPVAAEDEWGVLKVGCVNGGIFNPEENKSLPAELDPLPALGIRKGDLLISRANTRELVGSAAVTLRDYPNLLLCDKLYRLRLDGALASAKFVAYYLSIGQVRGQIELAASGASSSMLNISQATILEMAIALPADEEQQEIVAFIESEQIKLNALIAEAQHAIDLLKERRTALISAAVTGQIDIRGLIKDEQEQAA